VCVSINLPLTPCIHVAGRSRPDGQEKWQERRCGPFSSESAGFQGQEITSDLDALDLRKDPPEGDSSTYRIDVALNPQKIKPGKLAGYIEIDTDDKDFPKIKVPVAGGVF
jgi:hypothetical protein